MEQRITAPNGCKIESVEHDDNSVVIIFSEDNPKFKRGDFLICITSEITVIFEELESAQGKTFETFYNNSGYSNVNWSLGYFRLCTDKEKQEMIDYMHSNGKDWDEVNMKVIPYVWKPKDKELVWAWDDDDDCRRAAIFYDSKNNCAFSYEGERNGHVFDNYAQFEGEYPQWAKEALSKLEE